MKSEINKLLDQLEAKVHEKFEKVNLAYRFFAGLTFPQKISFNDFVIGLENLRLKLSTKEVIAMFEALDQDKDGYISYNEFCELSEERRRGIDPFDSPHKKVSLQFYENQRRNLSQTIPP